MKKIGILVVLTLVFASSFGQISGKVTDVTTGEALTGAHVILYQEPGSVPADQAVTGRNGTFIFTGHYGNAVNVVVSYLGYKMYRSLILDATIPEDLDIQLEPAAVPVGEVTISTTKKEQSQREIAIPMSVVTEKKIDRIAGFTTPGVLQDEPGIHLVRDGIWATSVNIRGLSEERIVTLVDGNRIETATDIAAGLAMVDINDIERIEVIKGAASALYGTGALGGVVNIITKDGHYNDGLYTEGNVTGAFQSVNNMYAENAALLMGNKKWYVRLSGTNRDAQNTMTPEGELANSQFSDKNFSAKLAVRPFINHELKLNYQRFDARDVGIPGGAVFPGPATATYPREQRDMLSARYRITLGNGVFRDVEIKYFHQYILRDVLLKPSPLATINPKGYHTTDGIQLKTSFVPAEGHTTIAGIDLWQRRLSTERLKDIYQPVPGFPDSLNHILRGEVPIPKSRYASGGFYLQDEFMTFSDKFKVTIGGRLDLINVKNDKAVDPVYLIINGYPQEPVKNQRITFMGNDVNNYSWSANLGLLYHVNPDFDMTASLSRAFRSPSIEERYKYIDLAALGKVEIGDPNLKPEDGYFADLGFKIWKDRFHFSLDGFVNSLTNMIVAMPGTAIYNYTNNPGQQDTVSALINSNVDKALLYGYDMSFSFNLFDGLTLFGSSSFVRGINQTRDGVNLPLIPPLKGRTGIGYQDQKWFGAEIACNMTARQDKIVEGETATGGYATYDFNIYSKPVDFGFSTINLFAGVNNIFNRAYINFLSSNRGLIKYEPGRNLYVKLKIAF
ncbi:MAG TPA: TonB-dependent receptor [Bacteroidales bacterium]|nr:TonB-dependent receptor [Bacteroidales bacterium]